MLNDHSKCLNLIVRGNLFLRVKILTNPINDARNVPTNTDVNTSKYDIYLSDSRMR